MTTSTPPRCYLCGAKSASRCSRCANASRDVYFCSEEHQRLSWKTGHSKLCGERVFRWPLLTKEEAAYVPTIVDVPDPNNGETLADTLRDDPQVWPIERAVAQLSEPDSSLAPHEFALLLPMVRTFEYVLLGTRHALPKPAIGTGLLRAACTSLLLSQAILKANRQRGIFRDLADLEWWDPIQQLMLQLGIVFEATMSTRAVRQLGNQQPYLKALIWHEELMKALRRVVQERTGWPRVTVEQVLAFLELVPQ
ncbi:hypothetical protein JCM10207_004837 [Rhodosporidiobolus poonsookiae]